MAVAKHSVTASIMHAVKKHPTKLMFCKGETFCEGPVNYCCSFFKFSLLVVETAEGGGSAGQLSFFKICKIAVFFLIACILSCEQDEGAFIIYDPQGMLIVGMGFRP